APPQSSPATPRGRRSVRPGAPTAHRSPAAGAGRRSRASLRPQQGTYQFRESGGRIVRAVREHLFGRSGTVGTRGTQPLSYNLRLPDAAQADALRLLDVSRAVINQALPALWPYLNAFTAERSSPAWKQVDALLSSPAPHGSRQWR